MKKLIHLNPEKLPISMRLTCAKHERMLENYVMDGHGGVVGEYAEL